MRNDPKSDADFPARGSRAGWKVCVTLLLFLASFARAGDTFDVSPDFELDTRDAIGTTVGVSGSFGLDTRALTGQTGVGASPASPVPSRSRRGPA